ncbi:MAG: PKD domain-containing protein [Thermoplasmatota archaeon]
MPSLSKSEIIRRTPSVIVILMILFSVGALLIREHADGDQADVGANDDIDSRTLEAPTAGGTLSSFTTGVSNGLPQNVANFRDFSAIDVADVNGDGDLDLAFGGGAWNPANTKGLYVYTGDGAGNWTKTSSGLPTVDSWGRVAFGDADNDGRMELYAANEGWGAASGSIKGLGAWEYSSGSWSTTGISSPITTGATNGVILKNFTKGPGLDLAITYSRGSTNGVRVYYGNGSSPINWTDNSNGLPTSGEYTDVAVLDMNKDNLPDLVVGSYNNRGIKFFTQNSNGSGWTDRTSSLPSTVKTGDSLGIVLGDVNGDSHNDITYSNMDYGMITLLGNSGGTGGTSFSWTSPTNGFPSNFGSSGRFGQIRLADIDKDGDLDLLAPKAGTGLYLFLGNGSTTPGTAFGWTQVTGKNLPTNMTIYGSAFFDMDSDGDLDLAAATWGDGVKIYRTNLGGVQVNNPPVPDAGSNIATRVGANVTLDGTGSSDQEDAPSGDTQGTILTYEWNVTSKPTGSTLSDSTLRPSDKVAKPYFTPDKEGAYVIKLSVKDTDGAWSKPVDEDSVTVTVTNSPPVPDAGTNITVILGTNVTLNGTGSRDQEDAPTGDAQGTILTYEWNVTTKPAGSGISDLSLGPSDKVARPYFVPDKEGIYIIKLAVRDRYMKWSNLGTEDQVKVTVTNSAPVPDAGPDQIVYVLDKVTLNGTGSTDPEDAPAGDPAGIILSYEWNVTKYPKGSLIRDSSLMTSDKVSMPYFHPDKVGEYEFSLAVKDRFGKWSHQASQDSILIDVLKPNDPPIADAGVDISRYNNTIIYLNGSKSIDVDGSIIHWNWTCISHDVVLTFQDTDHPFFYADQEGIYVFTLKVQDDNMTWSRNEDMVNITVVDPGINLLPSSDAGKDIKIVLGEKVVLNGSLSEDPDGYIISWIWTCTSHSGIVLMDSNSSQPYFTPLTAGTYVFSLVVMDSNFTYSQPDEVRVIVDEPFVNSRPSANAGSDLIAYTGDTVQLDGSESFDLDGLVEGYNWTCLNHTVELMNASTGKPSFIPLEPGEYVFSLSVMDDLGAWSDPDIVVVLVFKRYQPPPPIQNVTPYIGPFVYDDGSPVYNATVTLSPLDEWPWGSNWTVEDATSSDGYAYYSMGIPPGNYSCTVVLENGTLVGSVDILVMKDGSFIVTGGQLPVAPSPFIPGDDDDDIVVDDDDVVDDDVVDDDIVDDDVVDDDVVDDDTVDDDTADDDDTRDPGKDARTPLIIGIIIASIILVVILIVLFLIYRKPEKAEHVEHDWKKYEEASEE